MDISKKTFWILIVALIFLRIFLLILVIHNIPFTDMQMGGFRPHFNNSYQPDEQEFFGIAKELLSGKIAKLYSENIGTSLFLAPIIYFTGANSVLDIVKPVFIIQAFIVFTIALIIIVLIARIIFNSNLLAIISAFLFAFYPWLLLLAGEIIGYKNAIPAFHYQLWIMIHSDYLSAFFVYLSFLLVFKWFSNIFRNSEDGFGKSILLAVISGIALLIRMTNIWLVLITLAVFLYFRSFKKFFLYCAILFTVYLPQLIFNWLAFGAPWIYGFKAKGGGFYATPWSALFNIPHFWMNFAHFSPRYYILWFAAIVAICLLIFIFGFKYFRKIDKFYAHILISWTLPWLIFYGFFSGSFAQLRYFLPIIPVFIYFLVAAIVYLTTRLKFGHR